jgi:DNA sulfur modification protein DndD
MKLISIRLCNFRSFYGKTPEIMLAGGNIRNTTIIHGNTGTGKTSLLNAFTWVLYEKFSAAFALPDQLVNKRAIAEAQKGESIECWVEIAWEHDAKNYRVKRECRVYKNATDIEPGKTKLYMQIAGDDGKWYFPTQQPEEIINQILPSSLHKYFFFDGERIEHIVRADKKAEIAEAMKMLLGVEVINRSIKHLGEAKKSLEGELKVIGDAEIRQILSKQTKIELEIEKLKKRNHEIGQELEHQNTFKKDTSNRLRELSAAKELDERRQSLEVQKKSYQGQLVKAKNTVKKIISSRGYTVLLPETTTRFREIVRNSKRDGEITTKVSREILQELMDRGRCICNAALKEGTSTRRCIQELLKNATSSGVEETAFRMGVQVDEVDKAASVFWEEIDKEQARINEIKQIISQVEEELDSIQERLRKSPEEEIRGLQRRLDEIEKKIIELTLEQGRNQQKFEILNSDLDAVNKEIAKQKVNEVKQALLQRRITSVRDAIDVLTEVKTRQEKNFRWQLEKRVQEIFREISFTPYFPKITDKYELFLMENTSGVEMPVAASTGENQILCLSFISAIMDRVREWSEKKKMLMLPESSTFPLIMDSAFGSLDEISRRHVATVIPRLANQLIVLVSKTQWRFEVEEQMEQRVGKEYVLTCYSPRDDSQLDDIDLHGERYSLVRKSPNDFEYTEIVEVR